MTQKLFATDKTFAPLIVRLLLAIVIFPHGAQKLFGWFNGSGFSDNMHFLTQTVGLPWAIGLCVIIIEFFAPLALIAGFATRISSAAILVVMAGIIITQFKEYFFMNWYGTQPTEGSEFFLLAIGMCLSLMISGAGIYSVDGVISSGRRQG